jgi:hypothetical protein
MGLASSPRSLVSTVSTPRLLLGFGFDCSLQRWRHGSSARFCRLTANPRLWRNSLASPGHVVASRKNLPRNGEQAADDCTRGSVGRAHIASLGHPNVSPLSLVHPISSPRLHHQHVPEPRHARYNPDVEEPCLSTLFSSHTVAVVWRPSFLSFGFFNTAPAAGFVLWFLRERC